jgi:peptidoglycan/xylan/chitin deacetylase (PgdA/CDA1 family)
MRARPLAILCLCLAPVVAACLPDSAGRPGGGAGPSGSPAIADTPAPTGPTPVPSFARPTPTPIPSFRAYEVVPGDTLISIARTFDTTARSIAYWNRGTYPSLDPEAPEYAPNRIKAGWVLLLIPGAVVDPQTLPDHTPPPASPEPGATPIPVEPVVTPAPGAGAIAISHAERTVSKVALTFDMGDRLETAPDILDYLTHNEIPVSIFAEGETATTTARGRAVLQSAAERPDLFDVGNFTWDGPVLTDLDGPAIVEQLSRAEAAISTFANITTKPWFRPPDGAWDDDVRHAVGRAGWAYLMLWDVDPQDAVPTTDGGPTAEEIAAKIVSQVQPGSIVLLHLGGEHTLEALPAILDGLDAKGLEPVTLSELLVP